jgi:nucleoside 2-deoxyribosyltransferase
VENERSSIASRAGIPVFELAEVEKFERDAASCRDLSFEALKPSAMRSNIVHRMLKETTRFMFVLKLLSFSPKHAKIRAQL